MIVNETSVRKVIPVASGKGGVGKSFVTANLGILLASYAKRTILIDLDLGGSNLHTYLGMKNRNRGIGNFLSDKKLKFEDLLVDTPYENLRFIPGDVLVAGTANMTQAQRNSVLKQIDKLDADYILLDLGSGTSLNVIDFFLVSNAGFVVTTPQTPSILNAYNFLKNAAFRQLQRALTSPKNVTSYLKEVVKEQAPGSTPTIGRIVKGIQEIDKEAGKRAKEEIDRIHPVIVVNMADDAEDMDIVENLRDLLVKNFDLRLSCLGLIYQDRAVRKALKEMKPLVSSSSDSVVTLELDRMAQKIVQSPRFPTMPLDLNEYSDSFELARLEAQNDASDGQGAETPGEETGLSEEEFMKIISAQKQQIEELQGTVRMLTMNQR